MMTSLLIIISIFNQAASALIIIARDGKELKMNTLLGEVGKLKLQGLSHLSTTSFLKTAMLNDVLYARYRVALKFRKLQKSLLCKFLRSAHLVDLRTCDGGDRARHTCVHTTIMHSFPTPQWNTTKLGRCRRRSF